MKLGLWYFAHPYSCIGADGNQILSGLIANFNLCNYRASELIRLGYNIFSPISHSHPIQMASPELCKMRGTEEGKMWYGLDNQFIESTHFRGIILAPKWDCSTGCVGEKKLFSEMLKPIAYYEDIIGGVIDYE